MAQRFFDDASLERLVAVTMSLAAEVHVLRDRQRALEGVLRRRGWDVAAEIERWEPDEGERAQIDAERELYVRALFAPLAAEES